MIQEKTLTTLVYDKIKNIMTQHLAREVGWCCPKTAHCGYPERCRNPAGANVRAVSSIRAPANAVTGFRRARARRTDARGAVSETRSCSPSRTRCAPRGGEGRSAGGDENSLPVQIWQTARVASLGRGKVARCILGEDEIRHAPGAQSDPPADEDSRRARAGKTQRHDPDSTTQKFLQEAVISIRNGRYVSARQGECRSQCGARARPEQQRATLFVDPRPWSSWNETSAAVRGEKRYRTHPLRLTR
jgi:hypothetical protein